MMSNIKTRRGDIWILGEHRVMCGDATDKADIERLMDGERADLVFTDPPYGMKKGNKGILNDNLSSDGLLDFNSKWIPLSFDALKDNGSWYCWGKDEGLMDIYGFILRPMIKQKKIMFRNLLTWHKGVSQGQNSKRLRSYPVASEKCLFVIKGTHAFNESAENVKWCIPICEALKEKAKAKGLTARDMRVLLGRNPDGPDHFLEWRMFRFPKKEYWEAWFGEDDGYDEIKKKYEELKDEFKSKVAYFDNVSEPLSDVLVYNTLSFGETRKRFLQEIKDARGHPTPKPLKLCYIMIQASSKENDVVLDCFGGSGVTLITCDYIGRKCRIMELSEAYCDIIVDRWRDLHPLENAILVGPRG